MRKSSLKMKLPIFAKATPGKPGERFDFEGELFEVVRNLKTEEAKRLAPEFVALITSCITSDEPVHWVEGKKVRGVEVSATTRIANEPSRQQSWTIHGVPLHARVWTFQTARQMASLEETITKKRPELIKELQKACFYFLQGRIESSQLWVFLACDGVPEDARKRVAKLARDKGGLEIIPPPDDIVEHARQRFENMKQETPPGQISHGYLQH